MAAFCRDAANTTCTTKGRTHGVAFIEAKRAQVHRSHLSLHVVHLSLLFYIARVHRHACRRQRRVQQIRRPANSISETFDWRTSRK